MLNRSRRILWLVTGSDKVAALQRLRDGDRSIPAGRIQQGQAWFSPTGGGTATERR